MCFKGTHQLPTSKEVSGTYDAIGAYVNANTNKEYTSYIVKCSDEYTANCIDVLSDMVLQSSFTSSNMNLEKNVVKEETIRLDDSPEYHILSMKDRLLYAGTPYANPIDDLSYHIGKDPLPNKSVLEYYRKFYHPNRMGISIVSNLSFETIQRMVSHTYFTKRSVPTEIPRPIYTLSIHPDVQIDIRQKKGVNATHLDMSFRICEYGHPDMYRLILLSNIIGGYMSSRMFMILREKHGVTYKSICNTECYQPTGMLSLYTMCDHTKMMKNKDNKDVLELLAQLINQLKSHGVTQKEVEDAKGNYKGRYLQNLQDVQNSCFHNGLEMLIYDNPHSIPYQDVYKTYYAKITKKDINDMIQKYIRRENMVVCLFGEHVPSLASVEDVVYKIK
jgi:predicted Zn-dependent peptidase